MNSQFINVNPPELHISCTSLGYPAFIERRYV
jgi:hypothetical protein